MNQTIFITGGAGYIGSHVNKLFSENGYQTIILDNLSTGSKDLVKWGKLEIVDLNDTNRLNFLFQTYQPTAVIHLAASKSVGESVKDPEKYYKNNLQNTINLLSVMHQNNVKKIIFSSTAAVYGNPQYTPIDELHPLNPINPYGRTKLMIENILSDYSAAYNFSAIALRYFNAAGADKSGEIGEHLNSGQNLIPFIAKTALGINESLSVFGKDYPTQDGTCERDYIHVSDLATAHFKSFEYLQNHNSFEVFNLGNGHPATVNQVIKAAKKITQIDFSVKYVEKRPGDPAILIANNNKAIQMLNWKPVYTNIEDIFSSAWNWYKKI